MKKGELETVHPFLVDEIVIFNCCGYLVFKEFNPENNNENDGWDGTRNGE
ncbi:MAG: hypothetical protein HKO66_13040 [Saprospiraceae bacterium]|nr:hypothetical protein [Bacteroidia bacterium]NNE15389.1 hypothetical protein [Saprospiraceae bacterium]NNL93158.1 hypothetical protein [Saprospiraceae bacterium]